MSESKTIKVTPNEAGLIEWLRSHPEFAERFKSVMEIVSADGPIPKADDVEARVVEETRRLGKSMLEQWLTEAQARSAAEFQQSHAKCHVLKKRNSTGGRPSEK